MNKDSLLIKNLGYRLTASRREVLEAIGTSPLTAREIFSKLENSHDLATVYRNLELLVKLNLVSKIQFEDGVSRYELSNLKHHHHLICDNCGKVEDIPLQEEAILKQVSLRSSFSVKRHTLEFFGFCANCQ